MVPVLNLLESENLGSKGLRMFIQDNAKETTQMSIVPGVVVWMGAVVTTAVVGAGVEGAGVDGWGVVGGGVDGVSQVTVYLIPQQRNRTS